MMAAEPIVDGAEEDRVTVGRRAAARLRLAIPARVVSLYGTQPCILLDISRTGARMALPSPLVRGQSAYIAITRFELFGSVVRAEHGLNGAVSAMVFDDPITKSQILEIRRFAEGFAAREQSLLRDQVRRWVAGEA